MGIVTCGKRREGYFIIAGALAKLVALVVDYIGRLFSYRSVKEARLTEAAATDTATENFVNNPVMNNLNEGLTNLNRL